VLALLIVYLFVVVSAAGAVLAARGQATPWLLLIPALAALAIAYTFWVNVYPPQPGAYRVIPWIVIAWCGAAAAATLLAPALVNRAASGVLAASARTKLP
jgi:hypothetical protein